MIPTRVIPCLLLRNQGLVKTVRFGSPTYLGDPINVVRIFNDKEVDELVFLDITATPERKGPPFELLEKISSQCFMPLCYGGGVRTIRDMTALIKLGIEKVAVNSYAAERPAFVREAAERVGSQSVIVSIDVKRTWRGQYQVVTHGGHRKTGMNPIRWAEEMQRQGAGELLLNSVDRDGTMEGYDLELIRAVTAAVDLPVVACGGAATIDDLKAAILHGASAAAAGSMFVFQGPRRAVLISYPAPEVLARTFEGH